MPGAVPYEILLPSAGQSRIWGLGSKYAGRYTADGQKVIHHVDISWNQSWTGTDLVRLYKLDGNTLTITTAPAPSTTDGEEGQWILVWKKVQQEA